MHAFTYVSLRYSPISNLRITCLDNLIQNNSLVVLRKHRGCFYLCFSKETSTEGGEKKVQNGVLLFSNSAVIKVYGMHNIAYILMTED